MIELIVHYRLIPTRSCQYVGKKGMDNAFGGGKTYDANKTMTFQKTYDNKHPFNIITKEVLGD